MPFNRWLTLYLTENFIILSIMTIGLKGEETGSLGSIFLPRWTNSHQHARTRQSGLTLIAFQARTVSYWLRFA